MTPDFINSLNDDQRQEWTDSKSQLDAVHKRLAGLDEQNNERDRNDAIRELVGHERDWASKSARDSARQLLSYQLKIEAGVPVVTDGSGNALMGQHGLMQPSELLSKFRTEHPEFLKQSSAAVKQAEDPMTSDENLKRLFGAKSEGWYAAKVAREDLTLYRKLRTLAKERGIN